MRSPNACIYPRSTYRKRGGEDSRWGLYLKSRRAIFPLKREGEFTTASTARGNLLRIKRIRIDNQEHHFF